MAKGYFIYEGRQILLFDREDEIPAGMQGQLAGFENPETMQIGGEVGIDDALVYDLIPTRNGTRFSTLTAVRIIVPHRTSTRSSWVTAPGLRESFTGRLEAVPQPTALQPPDQVPLVFEWTVLLVAMLVMAVAAVIIGLLFVIDHWITYNQQCLIAHSGEIESEWDVDLNGDGIMDVHHVKYNNGRTVSWATSEYGQQSGAPVLPESTIDPDWNPQDILDLAGFWPQIGAAVKWGAIGLLVIGGIYVSAKAYQSIKKGEELRFPMVEKGIRFIGAKAKGVVA